MEKKIIASIIIFFLFIKLFSFFVGQAYTPPGKIFLGTVHHPPDYLYYLSHITQSREHLILTEYLTTTEPMPKLFLGWTYVLLGKIGNLFNAPPWISYHFGLFIFGLAYLVSAYILIHLLIPSSSKGRILAFMLFMFSNTFPRFITENGKMIIAPVFSWYNYGEPFIRFDNVPHHHLINASIFIILITYFLYHKSSRKNRFFLVIISAVAGISLGSMQPVQWILITIGLTLSTLLFDQGSIKNRIVFRLPLIIFILSGFPFVLYLKYVISNLEPYKIASAWEAAQSFAFKWDQYHKDYGLVFLVGLVGIPIFLKTKLFSRKTIFLVTLIPLVIFASPISMKLPILNFRLLSPLLVLLLAVCATEAIRVIPKIIKPFTPLIQSVFVTLLFAMLFPLFHYHLQSRVYFPQSEETVYLSRDIYDLFKKAGTISTSNDVFLIYWPYEVIFPAISGRREYFTTKLLTLDYDRKSGEAYQFLTNKITQEEKKDFLQKNKITYIISGSDEQLARDPFLAPIASSKELTLFKVNL